MSDYCDICSASIYGYNDCVICKKCCNYICLDCCIDPNIIDKTYAKYKEIYGEKLSIDEFSDNLCSGEYGEMTSMCINCKNENDYNNLLDKFNKLTKEYDKLKVMLLHCKNIDKGVMKTICDYM